jgi:uncharacterized membrane protein
MNASFIQRVSVTSALTLVFVIGSANAAAYSWTEILIPRIGPIGSAAGINDKGQVAVGSADGSKWGIYRNGIFTPLPPLPAGYKINLVFGINNSGIIVGGAFPPTDPTHEQGFILIGSKYTFFSRPGWNNTEARAIANSGLITGFSYTDGLSTTGGFIYDPATGTFTDATPPGSGTGFSATQGMNAAGRISGDGRSSEFGRYAFVWQQGALSTGARTLEPFLARVKIADSGSAARGINDAGVIVGFFDNSGSPAGFVGNDARGFQLLVPPGGDAPGAGVVCEGINNFRQVVCGVQDVNGNTVGEFIGTPDANEQ